MSTREDPVLDETAASGEWVDTARVGGIAAVDVVAAIIENVGTGVDQHDRHNAEREQRCRPGNWDFRVDECSGDQYRQNGR